MGVHIKVELERSGEPQQRVRSAWWDAGAGVCRPGLAEVLDTLSTRHVKTAAQHPSASARLLLEASRRLFGQGRVVSFSEDPVSQGDGIKRRLSVGCGKPRGHRLRVWDLRAAHGPDDGAPCERADMPAPPPPPCPGAVRFTAVLIIIFMWMISLIMFSLS